MFDTKGMKEQSSFEELEATTLFCPKCKEAVPVRKRLLLVLPDGDKYDYMCADCGTSVGSKKVSKKDNMQILI